ncbi:MAG: CPBP family intramembrane glutamic endopeptidase [Flavobacteriaceae bacterium]|nr:CPBP family intramembrane metalloprotease [Flavobacteriaceae bacterium]
MKNKTNWTEVITFYIIACAFSWPFFAWRDLYTESWANSSIPSAVRNLGIMWGPGIAAILCFIIFKKTHVRTISLTGTSLQKSVLFFSLPYLVWIILTLINSDDNSVKPSFFLEMIPFGFLMILGEELGWRGFLQDSLRNLKEWKKWTILGLMWEFWHFTRGLTHGELPQIILRKSIFIISVLILTFVIGRLTDKTKSLLIAITLHTWVNIQFEFPHINTHIAGGVSLVIWTMLIWKWNSEQKKSKI